ncbi:hypothetical protein BCR36DRAFT_354753 [Piromyces finnis]|uniref:SMP-LTD domain-containing protein n=1 Tax=Piromyces finnis TaxID=1754191 RepID=A0A1Y1V6I7_9FUNG|nr:hypothetical protein BCR36DRAFT_354753 [Piromyces finnis]|eukprot:ORX48418.1 hypothetical protein BCR36DRAFT_354753 [Piromyces finnis]
MLNFLLFKVFITIASEVYIIYYIYSLIISIRNERKQNNVKNNKDTNIEETIKNNELEEIKQNNSEKDEDSSKTDKDGWPPKIIEYLENCLFPQYNDKSNPPTECCTWVNIVFARYFLELRKAKDFKERMMKKLNEKFTRKLKNNSYIQSVALTDFDLGEVCPHFNGVRVKKSTTEKLEVNLEMEMEYSGAPNSLSFNLDIILVKGIIIPVKIKLLKCNGTLLIVVPYLKDPTLFGITFVNNPNPEFSIEVLSNKMKDKKKYLLSPILSVLNKLLKSFFVEFCTLPAIRTFDLPLVAPKIPIYVYLSDNKKMSSINLQPPPIQSTKRNTNNQKLLDIFEDKTFPIYTHVSSSNALLLNEKLTSTFIQLAKENNNDIIKLLEKRQSIDQNPLNFEIWKTLKNKNGIHVQKKLINEYGERGCIFKGTFVVRMNPKDVYGIIKNMSNEASGYIFNETFIRSSIVKCFNDDTLVRHISFKLNRQQNHGYVLFEAHKEFNEDNQNDDFFDYLSSDKQTAIIEEDENQQKRYVVVWRSIAGIKNEENDNMDTLNKQKLLNRKNNFSKERLRSYTTNDIIEKVNREQLINSLKQNDDEKLLNNKNENLKVNDDSLLKVNSSNSIKREHVSSNSYFSLHGLLKNEIDSTMEILQKSTIINDKSEHIPRLKKENSFRGNILEKDSHIMEKTTSNSNISETNNNNNKIKENQEFSENIDNLDVKVTSSKDDIVYEENFKINNRPAGMFKLYLSDDEEPYDNYLNSNRTDSSTSSLASLSEKYEDNSSVINEDSLEKKDELLDTFGNDLLETDKNAELSILEPKPTNVNDDKSYDPQNIKECPIKQNNDKDELYENINALLIKGFYLEPQLGDPEACYLTVISQFESSFKKFEATYEYCRKLKKYLEDQNSTAHYNSNINITEEDKKKSFGRSISSENIAKLGKIKNYLSSGLVKVKRSHSSMKDSTKPPMLKYDTLSMTKSKNDVISPTKLKVDIYALNNKIKPEEHNSSNSPQSDAINEANETSSNEMNISPIKYSPLSNNDELSKSIPVPPISSMPNTTATTNNSQSNKKSVIRIFKKVQKVVTKRSSSSTNNSISIVSDERPSPKNEDNNCTSNLYLSDICHSTESVNSLDEEKEKEIHTKNNIVILKHVNRPNIPLNKQNFTNQFINNKETIKVESQHLGGETWNDLRFEFNEAKNLPLDFSVSFKPNIIGLFDKWKHIYSESPNEPGVFTIIPTYTCSTSQTLKIINGCISIYSFPPGIFIFKWENNARKTAKHISFRFAIQPVTLLCSPIQNSLSQYCNEYNSVVSIRQRSCGTFSLPYIPLSDFCYKSIGISGRTAFLSYQIYTKGSDIQFGILFEPLHESNNVSMQELSIQQQQQSIEVINSKRLSNRKTSSYSNILSEESYRNNILEESRFRHSDENLLSPKTEVVIENINLTSEIHTNIGKDSFELKPNQRYVVPIAKCNSHKNVLNGTIPIANKFGIYTFVFNNSFSIVTSKTLELNIKLLIL